MSDPPFKAYGEGRARSNISYGEVERAAIAILKSERRPTVETVREALGSGSPDTIGSALRRFWRDLGARIEGDPAALTRMPPDIADLADGMWQRALKLAGEAAKNDDNAARARLAQIQLENELKKQSFELRESELDAQARERERALADSREHLLLLMKNLSRSQAQLRASEVRVAELQTRVEQYRGQLAALVASAVAQNRARKRPESDRSVSPVATRRRALTKRQARPRKEVKTRPKKAKRASPVPKKGARSKLTTRRAR